MGSTTVYADRPEAGRALAERLGAMSGEDVVVLGLPRGGVPVAAEVARALGAPLDVIVVRKLGVPFQPELGMGAIGEGGVRLLNPEVIRAARISQRELARVEERERAELERRAERFRGGRPRLDLAGRTALVVDDGLATGFTARAACRVARALGAARIVLAVPVGSIEAVQIVREDADEVVCLQTPPGFYAIGQWYVDFAQTSDDEVVRLLHPAGTPEAEADPPVAEGRDEDVEIETRSARLPGHLTVPKGATGVVVFVHGSGSSRHSPRNRYVASVLSDAGLATLLLDLLTPREELDRANVFDVRLLAARLADVTEWLGTQADVATARVCYFGASTGAAAALWAAAEPGADVAAVVSRGGRPDLAGARLGAVRAPTLLIVGGDDLVVLDLNGQAQRVLQCENKLTVVPGATHLFEEPGALEAVAELARGWFVSHVDEGGSS
jgi:putative phosphoribosyl transferase